MQNREGMVWHDSCLKFDCKMFALFELRNVQKAFLLMFTQLKTFRFF
jgi:hypothetical protein